MSRPDPGVQGLLSQQSQRRALRLPPRGWRRVRVLLGRALTRRCPYCGGGGIFRGWLTLRQTCPTCGTRFEREHGYFLGAYAINLIVAEFLGFGVVIWLLAFSDWSVLAMQAAAVVLAVGLPILFFPYSRELWIVLDLLLHPPDAPWAAETDWENSLTPRPPLPHSGEGEHDAASAPLARGRETGRG